MQRRKHSKALIEPPQLDPHLPSAFFEGTELVDGSLFNQVQIADMEAVGREAEDVCFDQAILRRVLLSETRLAMAQLLDARLDGCDLAGATWEKAHLQRVELLGCRLVGFTLPDSQCDNVLVRRCNAESASFQSSSFRASRFENCTLRAASFEGANLAGVVFRGCDLSGADLRYAKLNGADLRGCDLSNIHVNITDLRGLILDPPQMLQVAGLLGVSVVPLDGEE